MDATEELRRLLDERGVEWEDGKKYGSNAVTYFAVNGVRLRHVDYGDYRWLDYHENAPLTPEQAVEATLGRGTCRFEWSLADNGWASHTCSECGFTQNADVHVQLGWNYCPNCGRKVVDV